MVNQVYFYSKVNFDVNIILKNTNLVAYYLEYTIHFCFFFYFLVEIVGTQEIPRA